MIGRLIGTGFGRSVLAVRTLVPVLLLATFNLFYARAAAATPGVNGWDVFYPTVTDTLTVAVIVFGWWLMQLVPEISRASDELVLLRHGSRARVVRAAMTRLTGSLLAWAALVAAVSLAIDAPLGVSSQWSEAARSRTHGSVSAYTSTAYAHWLPNPLLALAAAILVPALALLCTAALALAVAARGHPTAATVGLIVFGLWSVLCSFSLLPIPPVVDTSTLLSLGWALNVPGGLAIVTSWFALGAALTALLLTRRSITGLVRDAARHRAVLAAGAGALLALAYWHADPGQPGATRRVFAGMFGDISSYVLVQAVPLLISAGIVARLAQASDGRLFYESLRHGSYRRWQRRLLLDEAGFAAGLYLAVGVIFALVPGTRGELPALASAVFGLTAATLLYAGIALLTFWTSTSQNVTWPIVVAAALVLGYWVPTAEVNIAAPFSLPSPPEPTTSSVSASVLALIAAAALIVVADRRAVPAHADAIA